MYMYMYTITYTHTSVCYHAMPQAIPTHHSVEDNHYHDSHTLYNNGRVHTQELAGGEQLPDIDKDITEQVSGTKICSLYLLPLNCFLQASQPRSCHTQLARAGSYQGDSKASLLYYTEHVL